MGLGQSWSAMNNAMSSSRDGVYSLVAQLINESGESVTVISKLLLKFNKFLIAGANPKAPSFSNPFSCPREQQIFPRIHAINGYFQRRRSTVDAKHGSFR